MDHTDIPTSAGSIVTFQSPGLGRWVAVLAPDGWDPRTKTFTWASWCRGSYDFVNSQAEGPVQVPANELIRKGLQVIRIGPAASTPRARAMSRHGAVALMDGQVFTYCPSGIDRDNRFTDGIWVHPAGDVRAAGDVERHGLELVPGMP
jgi:hypothetical protein